MSSEMTPPREEREMTNRERAEKIAMMPYGLGAHLLAGAVERALDEKDAEWNKRYEDHSCHQEKVSCERGQREMRERAARVCDESVKWYASMNINECTMTPPELAKAIRSLPTDKLFMRLGEVLGEKPVSGEEGEK